MCYYLPLLVEEGSQVEAPFQSEVPSVEEEVVQMGDLLLCSFPGSEGETGPVEETAFVLEKEEDRRESLGGIYTPRSLVGGRSSTELTLCECITVQLVEERAPPAAGASADIRLGGESHPPGSGVELGQPLLRNQG